MADYKDIFSLCASHPKCWAANSESESGCPMWTVCFGTEFDRFPGETEANYSQRFDAFLISEYERLASEGKIQAR